MQVWLPGDQICQWCKWCCLVTEFATDTVDNNPSYGLNAMAHSACSKVLQMCSTKYFFRNPRDFLPLLPACPSFVICLSTGQTSPTKASKKTWKNLCKIQKRFVLNMEKFQATHLRRSVVKNCETFYQVFWFLWHYCPFCGGLCFLDNVGALGR